MRVAFFARKLKQPVYIVHVSSADGAEMVAKIKEENRYIFAETTSPLSFRNVRAIRRHGPD